MIQLNRVKVCAMIVFIVLALSSVLASSENSEKSEAGTMENPFLIDLSGASSSVTFQYTSFPFYFKTNTSGSYEVDIDASKNEATFMLVDNNVGQITVLIDEFEEFENHDAKQLGVNSKGISKSKIGTPMYQLNEIIATDGGTVIRRKKLDNVAPNASLLASRGNLFFFLGLSGADLQAEINKFCEESYQRLKDAAPEEGGSPLQRSTSLSSYIESVKFGEVETYGATTSYTSYGGTVLYQCYQATNVNEIVYECTGVQNSALTNMDKADTNSIEAIITRLFTSFGDRFLLDSIRSLFGSNISINTLIFNQFEMTKLDLYNQEATGINGALRDAVTKWYNALLTFTLVMYMIILVYTGIMAVAAAGTPRQERVKSYFTNWVIGLVILIFLPNYGFPLLFKINDALVAYIGKDADSMDTYYTVLERYDEIDGGDSMTELIQKLEEERGKAEEAAQTTQESIDAEIARIQEKVINNFKNRLKGKVTDDEMTEILDKIENSSNRQITTWFQNAYATYKNNRSIYETRYSEDEANRRVKQDLKGILDEDSETILTTEFYQYMIENNVIEEISQDYDTLYQKELEIEQINKDIVTLQNDILGLMRSYAGEYQRLVFGVLFLMLLFQLIGLLILYFKRMIMIAILITIFPLIMLFYCIDKMADNTAQTLSLWFKEFLSNIFIQSVHAVVYRVLIEMGLEIFKRDNGNWLLLVVAMLLLIPAESIMKSIFGLNGSTLGQIGGMLTKATIGIGAIKSLATAGKGKNDKSITTKEKRFVSNMQRKQNIADNKAIARNYKRTMNNKSQSSDFVKNAKNKLYDAGDKLHSAGNAIRHGRVKLHNAKNVVGTYTRAARNAAAITIGATYGLTGGDVNSLAEGAAIAKTLSGKQGTDKEYVKKQKALKNRVSGAYQRRNP